MLSNNELGKYLKDARNAKGLSLREVNKLTDISYSHLNMIENGKRNVTPALLKNLAKLYNLDYIDLYIELDKNTKNSLYLVNSSPYITSNIKLTARIQSLNSDIDLDDEKVVDRIEDYAEKYLKYHLYNYLYKTSKEFNSDIDNFGLYALKYFNNMSDLEEYNWNHHYKDTFFNVNVNVELRSSYLLVNTSKEEE